MFVVSEKSQSANRLQLVWMVTRRNWSWRSPVQEKHVKDISHLTTKFLLKNVS